MNVVQRTKAKTVANVNRQAFLGAIGSLLPEGVSKSAVMQLINDNGGRIELQQLCRFLKKLGVNRTDSVVLMEGIGIPAQDAGRVFEACCEASLGV